MSCEQPWRVGHRVPEHIYIGDRPLVTMPTAALAALVVAAVNGLDPAQRDWMAMQGRVVELETALQIQRDANADLDSRRGLLLVRIAQAVAGLRGCPANLESMTAAIERALVVLQ